MPPFVRSFVRCIVGRHLPRGFIHKGAALSAYHTLAIVNRSDASCADVLELAQLIVKGVFKRFHITLSPEVVYLGKTGIEQLPISLPK